MNLIEAYIYEVTKRLPDKMRNDIALELKITIEDMLPENYSEEEVKSVLLKLGNPAELASSYLDTPNYIIGPKMYDSYISTIKMIMPWIILIALLVHIVESIVLFTGEEELLSVIIQTFSMTFINLFPVLIQVLFWITVAFIIIERTGNLKPNIPLINYIHDWTPDDLKNTKIIPKEKNIQKRDLIFSLLGTVILAVVYFKANHIVGVYKSVDSNGLQFIMPAFNQETLLAFGPIVLVCIFLSIVLTLVKWTIGKWTIKLASFNAIVQLIGTIVFIIIITNANLIHEPIIPYMAELLQTTPTTVANSVNRIIQLTVAITIITNIFDIYNSFRKAKIQ
ncbi:MAG: hypothetical protein RR595_02855 [Lysinibacillus sp.]